ncbi:Zn-ribbon domain-containing OB-fold protein, partial [Thermodesulfobacteriota bacterium]
DQMEWFLVSGDGTLISFTKATFAPAGFEKDVPYMLGVAEFDDGVKVFGRIDKALEEESVKAGMKIKIRVVSLGQVEAAEDAEKKERLTLKLPQESSRRKPRRWTFLLSPDLAQDLRAMGRQIIPSGCTA